jgi:pyruvate,orthophosphate dikinase
MQIICIGSGSAEEIDPDIVGAKAANLARMAALGLPVPPAFVLPIELCAAIVRGDADAKQNVADGLSEGIDFLEQATGRIYGDRRRPLLVSVRSGAARSMPGMLDTVLDVGSTPEAVRGLVRMTGNPAFAHDCRCRFLESFGSVVLGIDAAAFTQRRDELVAAEGIEAGQALDCEALERLAASYETLVEREDDAVADDPMEQLVAAAEAVYRSWGSDRARTYRRIEHLEYLQGTAVTVEAMVFGNNGAASGAGVAFSRNPSTGAAEPVIDVLFESQGEDVVSGGRNPQTEEAIVRSLPAVAAQLLAALQRLEQAFGDVQDVEFTIESGTLWFLQTRSAKRTAQAAVRFAIDFVKEGRITPAAALRRLEGVDLSRLVRERLTGVGLPAARGTGASVGIAVGRAAFDADSAARLAKSGDPVILVRPTISTTDVAGFAASAGIVTAVGGRTAHAALVARQMGKPCVVGCAELAIDTLHGNCRIGGNAVNEGDWLSIDGNVGNVYIGRGEIISDRAESDLEEIARWRAQAAVPGAKSDAA